MEKRRLGDKATRGCGDAAKKSISPCPRVSQSSLRLCGETRYSAYGSCRKVDMKKRIFIEDDVSSNARESVMDDYTKCWNTYLSHEKELMRDHKGKYVAIYKKDIVAIGEDMESLAETIYEKYGPVEALICKIEEETEPIQMPPPRNIVES